MKAGRRQNERTRLRKRRLIPVDETMSQIFNRKQQTYELIAEFFGEALIEEDEQ